MVTLGSIQPADFQAFHGAGPYEDSLNFRSFELALNDLPDMTTPGEVEVDRGRAQEETRPARRDSVAPSTQPADRSEFTDNEAGRLAPKSTRHASSASHRLFRAAKPEQKSWHQPRPIEDTVDAVMPVLPVPERGTDSRSRASSWHAADMRTRRSPPPIASAHYYQSTSFALRSPKHGGPALRSRDDDKPQNEILDGSDVLQQISNLTSTEPSNEREVFVGGLRESEDSVHITEEELETYFSKFGLIESVSINRDDRTHRGRGFAFVKFLHEAAALDAVVADASTHVIRGTTVSVQWSRGAKDGGDRPRRRNSANSGTSSGNGSSPSRSSRTSPKTGLFSKAHRAGSRDGMCGVNCGHGFNPMRSRSQGHLHSGSGSSGVPYSYCGGGHGGEHVGQPMVCVVVPAQRAAALGLSHLPQHHTPGPCAARGSPPRDVHFTPLAQASSAGGVHSGYRGHTRSRSYSSTSAPGHAGTSAGGGYGHQGTEAQRAMNVPHHVASKGSHSYAAHAPMHMPPMYRERRERSEARAYCLPANGGAGHARADYDRAKFDVPTPSTSYPPPGWICEGKGSHSRSMGHDVMRSQSPPVARSVHSGRNGGGAPRPPPTPPRGYDSHLPPSRYKMAGIGDGFPAGITATGRRHSGSSVMSGRESMRQEAVAAANYYYSVGEIGSENAYEHDYSYAGPSRMV